MSNRLSFSDAEQDTKRKKTRREVFLDDMKAVAPWAALKAAIQPHDPRVGKARTRIPVQDAADPPDAAVIRALGLDDGKVDL